MEHPDLIRGKTGYEISTSNKEYNLHPYNLGAVNEVVMLFSFSVNGRVRGTVGATLYIFIRPFVSGRFRTKGSLVFIFNFSNQYRLRLIGRFRLLLFSILRHKIESRTTKRVILTKFLHLLNIKKAGHIEGKGTATFNIIKSHIVEAEIQGETNLELFVITNHTVEGEIIGSVLKHMLMRMFLDVDSNINGNIHIGKNIWMLQPLISSINGVSHVGKIMHESKLVEGSLTYLVHVGKTIHMIDVFHYHGAIDGFVSIGRMRVRRFTINRNLLNNTEVRINSANHTAVLVGASGQHTNIFHQYIGDWIKFNENVIRVKLDSMDGSNHLSGEVIFEPKFL